MRSLHRLLIRLRNFVTGRRGDARLRGEREPELTLFTA